MKRPGWWPAALWPVHEGTTGGQSAGLPRRTGQPLDAEPKDETGSGWDSYLDVLVTTLQARRGALWERNVERGRWVPAYQRFSPGWSGTAQQAVASSGHPFTWSIREELLLQLPCHRIQGVGDGEGWVLVIPDPGSGRVLSLWFGSPPGPGVRESLSAVRAHMAWLGRFREDDGEPAGHPRVDS